MLNGPPTGTRRVRAAGCTTRVLPTSSTPSPVPGHERLMTPSVRVGLVMAPQLPVTRVSSKWQNIIQLYYNSQL